MQYFAFHSDEILNITEELWLLQKQLSRGILKKRCSENMQQIYRRTLMLKYGFNKIALHFGMGVL